MQATYKIIGADGAEYGPVALADFKSWVSEGRVDAQTHVKRSDSEAWTTAASLPELGLRDQIGAIAAAAVDPVEVEALEKRIKGCGSWFYWIAALTFLNSVSAFFGSEWGFYLGVSALQALDYAVQAAPTVVRAIVVSVDLSVAAGIAFLGYLAMRRQAWPFLLGVILYGLDTLLNVFALLVGGSVIGLALHGWALFSLFLGFKAVREWRQRAPSTPATNGG